MRGQKLRQLKRAKKFRLKKPTGFFEACSRRCAGFGQAPDSASSLASPAVSKI